MTVYIDKHECTRVEKYEFQRAWNDGNLPTKVEVWEDDDGYIVVPYVEYFDFADFADNDTSAACGFTDDFTPSANLYAKVATVSGNKKLHIYDADVDEQVDG